MGDNKQATTFPAPPPFYKHFTAANLQQLQQQRPKKASEDELSSPASTILQLPAELRYLIPPQPPTDGRWRSFGYQHDLNAPDPTIEEAGVEKLYPDHPTVKLAPQAYLIALARSLLATFLSACGILAQNPTMYEQKAKDLRTMLINMHDLINQYRPHQARESLILMMEEHVDQLRQEIKTIGELKEKLQKAMSGIHQAKELKMPIEQGPVRGNDKSSLMSPRREQQEAAWGLLSGLSEATAEEQPSMAVEAG